MAPNKREATPDDDDAKKPASITREHKTGDQKPSRLKKGKSDQVKKAVTPEASNKIRRVVIKPKNVARKPVRTDDDEITTREEKGNKKLRIVINAKGVAKKPIRVAGKRKKGDDEDEVEIVADDRKPRSVKKTKNGDKDEEVRIVGVANEQPRLPHMRPHCTQHRFDETAIANGRFPEATLDTNKLSCDLCYCYMCDCPAKDCPSWNIGPSCGITGNHCCATDKNPLHVRLRGAKRGGLEQATAQLQRENTQRRRDEQASNPPRRVYAQRRRREQARSRGRSEESAEEEAIRQIERMLNGPPHMLSMMFLASMMMPRRRQRRRRRNT